MERPEKYIERMKNILIVALFISAMLLLYFFWENPILSDFSFSEIIAEEADPAPVANEVVQPEQVAVNFGTGVSTVVSYLDQDSWNRSILALRAFAQAEDLSLEPITKEQYDQIMQFRSILISFRYSLPFDDFCNRYVVNQPQTIAQIESFSALGYSAGSPESLFLVDETNDTYFRLISPTNQESLESLIVEIEQEEYEAYYPIGAFLGTANQTVMPLAADSSLKILTASPEFLSSDEEAVRRFAQSFFGESFDFVRRIEESKGTYIYMYGYGQKVLTFFADGSVEYKEDQNGSGAVQTYFEALDSALQFVASHGGFSPFGETSIHPSLRYSEAITNNKAKGYRFVFGMKINGEDVFSESSELLVVELLNGQVTHYRRDLVQAIPDDSKPGDDVRETYSPVNMLAQNYKYLYSILISEGYSFKESDGDALFDEVSDLIVQVQTGYVRRATEDGSVQTELIPAWIVIIDDLQIYFDLYEADPIGYAKISAAQE